MDNKDFDILAGILLNDKAYLGAGGANVIDDKGGFDAVTNMAYSVYLYLKKLDMLTLDNMREYLREMNKYVYYTGVSEYHLVNAAKLKMETGYGLPLDYCCVLDGRSSEFKKDVFDALMAFVRCPETLKTIVEYFENKDIENK